MKRKISERFLLKHRRELILVYKKNFQDSNLNEKCEEQDSNLRTSIRPGPQPGAFDRAWQSSRRLITGLNNFSASEPEGPINNIWTPVREARVLQSKRNLNCKSNLTSALHYYIRTTHK